MSDRKQTIDVCNGSLVLSRTFILWDTRSTEEPWMGMVIPKITMLPPPFKQHNRTIEAPLPFPHCLISAGYLRYLCGCSYLWPSACCSAAPALRRHLHHFAPAPTYLLPPNTHTHTPTPVRCDLQRGVITPWPIWRAPHVECAYAESAADPRSMGWGEVLTEIWLDTLYQMGKDEDETAAGAVVSNLAVIE